MSSNDVWDLVDISNGVKPVGNGCTGLNVILKGMSTDSKQGL
jgi:hypothetical protein